MATLDIRFCEFLWASVSMQDENEKDASIVVGEYVAFSTFQLRQASWLADYVIGGKIWDQRQQYGLNRLIDVLQFYLTTFCNFRPRTPVLFKGFMSHIGSFPIYKRFYVQILLHSA